MVENSAVVRHLCRGAPTILNEASIFLSDEAGKPLAIESRIGKRPIFATGNSDGDFEMLEWTTAGDGSRFGIIVHHTNSAREFAYDRESQAGTLARGLNKGAALGWLIVDMAKDWTRCGRAAKNRISINIQPLG